MSPDSVRKKQKLKTILTIIGDSLQSIFKKQIFELTGEMPSLISIDNVKSVEKGTSKSRVHFVTYDLSTNIGKQSVNLVVKFAADERRFEKEINNHQHIAKVADKFPGIYIPKIIYKSIQNKSIIYEGISGRSFRETQLDKNFKYSLAGQTLAVIHGKETGFFKTEIYRKLILYLLSTLNNSSLEEEIVDLMVPSFLSMEKSRGSTMIHGDYHQGNLLFSSDITTSSKHLTNEFPPKIRVYILDPEFIMFERDRNEDIGTFFAKPCIKEFKKYNTVEETQKNIQAFLHGYNSILDRLKTNFHLEDLYPKGHTIDFHICAYILFDTSEKIQRNEISADSKEFKTNISLLCKILSEKPFHFK